MAISPAIDTIPLNPSVPYGDDAVALLVSLDMLKEVISDVGVMAGAVEVAPTEEDILVIVLLFIVVLVVLSLVPAAIEAKSIINANVNTKFWGNKELQKMKMFIDKG